MERYSTALLRTSNLEQTKKTTWQLTLAVVEENRKILNLVSLSETQLTTMILKKILHERGTQQLNYTRKSLEIQQGLLTTAITVTI